MIEKRFQVAAACFITLASLLLTSCENAGAWIQLEQTLLDSGGNYETIGEVPDYGVILIWRSMTTNRNLPRKS